ncbi:MAG: hypothetical protein R3324_00675, partial [Halobacteriales archaeon]|nr:hypothetical protein [Halobacteriales archaeon]
PAPSRPCDKHMYSTRAARPDGSTVGRSGQRARRRERPGRPAGLAGPELVEGGDGAAEVRDHDGPADHEPDGEGLEELVIGDVLLDVPV